MFAEKPDNRQVKLGIGLKIIVLFIPFVSIFAANTQHLIAVLDLKSDGTVTESTIQPICDKISEEIAKDTHYIVFERKYLPFVIEPFQKNWTLPCTTEQCLSKLGKQIGANQIVAGSITQNKEEITIRLNRIDVQNARNIRSVSNKTPIIKKEEFISHKVPDLVQELMSDKAQSASADGKESFFSNPITIWSGIYVIGAVGLAAATVLLSKNEHAAPTPGESDLPLGNVPEHTR